MSFQLFSQTPTADFNLPADVCLDEQFQLENTSVNATSYEWEFCFSGFDGVTNVSEIGNLTGAGRILAFDVKKINGEWIGFAAGYSTNKLYRFIFQNGLDMPPTLIEEITLSAGFLGRALSIEMQYHQNNWYVLLYNRDDASIKSLNFGNSILNNTPSEFILKSGLSNSLVKMQILKEDNVYYLVVNNPNGSINILNTNNDFESPITEANTFLTSSISGVSSARDAKLIKENDSWYSFISDFNSKNIYRAKFNPDLMSGYLEEPTVIGTDLYSGNPNSIFLTKSDTGVYLHTLTFQGVLSKIKLTNIEAAINASDVEPYGTSNVYNEGYALKFFRDLGKWKGVVLKDNNNPDSKFFLVENNFQCNSSIIYSEDFQPTISYSSYGIYPIKLTAYDADGNSSSTINEITVQPLQGETVADPAYCVTNNIPFEFSTSENIVSYLWDFGDGSTSTAISPSHQYGSDGEYYISLEVESTAGCTNIFYDTLSILPEPQPEFITTKTEYCSFEPVAFSNTTPFDYGGNVAWSWDFNGEGNSTEENPNFTFETPGTKIITLEANVLGCIQTYQSTWEIIEGPEVDFSYDNNCLGEAIQFTNLSTGANITGYQWDFGNGESSTAENPQVTYVNPGTYALSLTVSNASGCDNTATQNIQIFEQLVDSIMSTEAIENLPFDLGIDWNNDFDSTQNLGYEWEVNGEIQTTDTATYTLGEGTYAVNLEVTTENGCLFTAQRSIEVKVSESPAPDFNLPVEVCLGEQFELENTSVNAARYEWDLCPFDLGQQHKNEVELIDFNFDNSIAFKIIQDGDSTFGFTFGRNNNNLYRLDYGENPSSEPGLTDLGNIDDLFRGPVAIDFIQEGDDWYALVTNYDNYDIIKLSFGSSLSNTPTAINLTNFGQISKPDGIHVKQYSDMIFAFVMNGTRITRLDFGNSINNTVTATSINVPNSNRLWGLDIIEDSGNYFGVLSSFGNSNVYYLEFGNDLSSTPAISEFDVSSLDLTSPGGLQLIKTDEKYYGFIQYRAGELVRFSFGSSMNINPIMQNLGRKEIIPPTSNAHVQILRDSSRWLGFTMNFGLSKLFRYEFVNECSATTDFSTETNPTLSLFLADTYPLKLTAYHENGKSKSITKEITVTENQAPEIAFTTGESLCVSAPIQFSSESNTEISSYSWDFGDGDASTEANPAHLFSSAGEYLVQLSVTDTAGCKNLFQDSVTIYAEPQPSFQAQVQGSICSQKPLNFTNTTNLPTSATFQWDFGDGNTSTEENPEHIYATEGEYIINFQIEMAGCLVEKTDTISVNPGPLVDFNYNDDCFGQVVNFENKSTGEFLQNFQWDFGDGTQSTQLNPNHSYDSAGTYNVQLSAFTSNGCDYTFEQEVIVHPIATVAFESEVGCANQPVQFNEEVVLQKSNITDYLWDFGISGTSSDLSAKANPQFTFPTAGTYQVHLQVTTADGCTSSGMQTVSVNALPQPAFTYEENCLNNPILFSPENTDNIIAHFWELQNQAGVVVFTAQSENFSYAFENSGSYQLRYRQQNENLCSNSITETIEILPLPEPEFQVSKICANEAVVLENITDLKGNILKNYSWSLDGETISTDFQPQYTFPNSGDFLLGLQVETQNGCIQNIEKTISVSPSPTAFFELEQTLAAFPYTLNLNAESVGQTTVRPANTDTEARSDASQTESVGQLPTSNFQLLTSNPQNPSSNITWTLNNDTISSSAQLNHTITEPGTYLLGLIITNEAGCSDTHYEQIRIRKPNLDIALNNLRITQDQEFTSFILNISNKGTLVPERLDLDIDLGSYSVTETIEEPLLPERNRNVALSIKLTEEQIRGLAKICIRAIPHNSQGSDSNENNNRVCTNIESGLIIMEIYPNPVATQFTMPLIIPENANVDLSLEQSNGQTVKTYFYDLEAGYHEIKIDRDNIKPGIYFLRIRYQGEEKVKKIIFQ
ncbi:PKD domain-containing protein [Marivirga salinae]|uniref:PKD domain-containing protein n=1 Tax=Marivirga salinarum TaxID=3059078 RepID=A0AA51RET2_9BACT|nr:PKD domain-containing protein [Marivirga sp. BDSF4-3]WMN12180.1 PKD domain-containing protein [Marivirga sp. BDSF4-3]